MPSILILTGPPASRKNTISHLYATQQREKCAVIDVDLVRHMLRQPHTAVWEGETGAYQHRLGIRHARMLGRSFVGEGCDVVITDVITDELAQLYRDQLDGYRVCIAHLTPSWEESLRRLRERHPTITETEAKMLYEWQASLRSTDYQLDNTHLSPEAAAKWLAEKINERWTANG